MAEPIAPAPSVRLSMRRFFWLPLWLSAVLVFAVLAGPVFPERWLHLNGRELGEAAPSSAQTEGNRICLPLDGSFSLDEMERSILTEALSRNGENIGLTARVLGTTREKLRYRVQKYGLKTSD